MGIESINRSVKFLLNFLSLFVIPWPVYGIILCDEALLILFCPTWSFSLFILGCWIHPPCNQTSDKLLYVAFPHCLVAATANGLLKRIETQRLFPAERTDRSFFLLQENRRNKRPDTADRPGFCWKHVRDGMLYFCFIKTEMWVTEEELSIKNYTALMS